MPVVRLEVGILMHAAQGNAAGCWRHGAMTLNLPPIRMSPKPVYQPSIDEGVVHRRAAGADRPPVGVDAPLRIDRRRRTRTVRDAVTRMWRGNSRCPRTLPSIPVRPVEAEGPSAFRQHLAGRDVPETGISEFSRRGRACRSIRLGGDASDYLGSAPTRATRSRRRAPCPWPAGEGLSYWANLHRINGGAVARHYGRTATATSQT